MSVFLRRPGNNLEKVAILKVNSEDVDEVAAQKVTYVDTQTQLGATNVQSAIQKLKTNFQDGVDAVFNACDAKGSTPASHSLSDVVAGIYAIPTGITPSGTIVITTNGDKDVTNYETAAVQVPASAVVSGTKNITTNGTTDVTTYASANVQVPASAVVSGTYTFPVGSTGTPVDGNVIQYRTADATNVYNKGKSDGASEVISDVVNISAVSSLEKTVSAYTKVFSYTFNKAGVFHVCYGHGEATNDDGHGSAVLRCFLGSDQLMQVQIDSDTATSSANIGTNSPYDREFNVTAGQEFSMYKQENYVEGQSGGTLRGYMAVTGYFKPTV